FVEVVGRQGMVDGSDESFEEVPGPARNQPEGASVGRSERLSADAPGWKTNLPCDRGGDNPKGDQRKHGSPSSVTPGGENAQRGQRKQYASGHAPIATGDRHIDRTFGSGCGHPFQQVP